MTFWSWRSLSTAALAMALASLGASTRPVRADEAPFRPTCTAKSPVDLEECFVEFVESGITDRRQWSAFLDSIKGKLYFNQEERVFRIHRVPPAERPFKAPPSKGVVHESEHPFGMREARRNVEVPYLSSGGWINVVTLRPSLDGHLEVTKRVLQKAFKFNYDAQLIAADAAQDPDFYAWTEDAAHAQTPAGESGGVSDANLDGARQARADFATWLAGRVTALKARCASGEPRYGLYLLGYALHAVQDLAPHNGRTIFEHSWNSYCKNPVCDDALPRAPKTADPDQGVDPDEFEGNIVLADLYSRWFLSAVRDAVGEACWISLKTFEGGVLSWPEKLSTFHLKWTLWPSEITAYRKARLIFAPARLQPGFRVRWLPEADRDNDRAVSSLWRSIRE